MARDIIEKKNLDEVVYDRIIEKIINSEFKQGEQLQINELIEEFEVSRTPIVQAIKMLCADEILAVTKTGKVFLPEFTEKQIIDIYETRLLFERYAVISICRRNDIDIIIRKLHNMNAACKEKLEKNEIVAYRKKDLDLHRVIIASTGNNFLEDLYCKTQNLYIVVNFLLGEHNMDNQTSSIIEHEELFNYIEEKNEKVALEMIEKHIKRGLFRILDSYKE